RAETTACTENALVLSSVADILDATDQFCGVLGASSSKYKFLAVILNQRSRELVGELMCWEDLARTKTYDKRNEAFHNEARPQENKHYVRPIPQSFLDNIHVDGRPLTAPEKTAMQNPGY